MDENEIPRDVRTASPCAEQWGDMAGTDCLRSCARCGQKVYNFSKLNRGDAADLVRNVHGSLQVRFYRRPDGMLLTRDCPVGAHALRQRIARTAGVAFASLLVWSGFSLTGKTRSHPPQLSRTLLDRPAPAEQALRSEVLQPLSVPAYEPAHGTVMESAESAAGDKRFLRDLTVDNTPRADPFAREGHTR